METENIQPEKTRWAIPPRSPGGWIFILGAAAIGLLLLIFQWREAKPTLPERVGAFQRIEVIAGEQARTILNRMHPTGVAPVDNLIGEYRRLGEKGTIYLSIYDDKRLPELQYVQMRDRIKRSGIPFQFEDEVVEEGQRMTRCGGMEQRHYFFAAEKRLYWLAVDTAAADLFLKDVLTIIAD